MLLLENLFGWYDATSFHTGQSLNVANFLDPIWRKLLFWQVRTATKKVIFPKKRPNSWGHMHLLGNFFGWYDATSFHTGQSLNIANFLDQIWRKLLFWQVRAATKTVIFPKKGPNSWGLRHLLGNFFGRNDARSVHTGQSLNLVKFLVPNLEKTFFFRKSRQPREYWFFKKWLVKQGILQDHDLQYAKGKMCFTTSLHWAKSSVVL